MALSEIVKAVIEDGLLKNLQEKVTGHTLPTLQALFDTVA